MYPPGSRLRDRCEAKSPSDFILLWKYSYELIEPLIINFCWPKHFVHIWDLFIPCFKAINSLQKQISNNLFLLLNCLHGLIRFQLKLFEYEKTVLKSNKGSNLVIEKKNHSVYVQVYSTVLNSKFMLIFTLLKLHQRFYK